MPVTFSQMVKNLHKNSGLLVTVILMVAISLSGCSVRQSETGQYKQKTVVEVVYFHTNYRCESCEAIKEETKKVLRELYGEKVHFAMYNLDEKSGRQEARLLDVKAQALLIISKEKRIDITATGYLYAYANPGLYRQKLKENVDSLLQ